MSGFENQDNLQTQVEQSETSDENKDQTLKILMESKAILKRAENNGINTEQIKKEYEEIRQATIAALKEEREKISGELGQLKLEVGDKDAITDEELQNIREEFEDLDALDYSVSYSEIKFLQEHVRKNGGSDIEVQKIQELATKIVDGEFGEDDLKILEGLKSDIEGVNQEDILVNTINNNPRILNQEFYYNEFKALPEDKKEESLNYLTDNPGDLIYITNSSFISEIVIFADKVDKGIPESYLNNSIKKSGEYLQTIQAEYLNISLVSGYSDSFLKNESSREVLLEKVRELKDHVKMVEMYNQIDPRRIQTMKAELSAITNYLINKFGELNINTPKDLKDSPDTEVKNNSNDLINEFKEFGDQLSVLKILGYVEKVGFTKFYSEHPDFVDNVLLTRQDLFKHFYPIHGNKELITKAITNNIKDAFFYAKGDLRSDIDLINLSMKYEGLEGIRNAEFKSYKDLQAAVDAMLDKGMSYNDIISNEIFRDKLTTLRNSGTVDRNGIGEKLYSDFKNFNNLVDQYSIKLKELGNNIDPETRKERLSLIVDEILDKNGINEKDKEEIKESLEKLKGELGAKELKEEMQKLLFLFGSEAKLKKATEEIQNRLRDENNKIPDVSKYRNAFEDFSKSEFTPNPNETKSESEARKIEEFLATINDPKEREIAKKAIKAIFEEQNIDNNTNQNAIDLALGKITESEYEKRQEEEYLKETFGEEKANNIINNREKKEENISNPKIKNITKTSNGNYNITSKDGSVLEGITQSEYILVKDNENALDNMSNMKETLDKCDMNYFWTVRHEIFTGMQPLGFNAKDDFVNNREMTVFLRTILKSLGEDLGESSDLNNLVGQVQRKNNVSGGVGNTKDVDYNGYSIIESEFRKKYHEVNSTLGFNLGAFQDALSKGVNKTAKSIAF